MIRVITALLLIGTAGGDVDMREMVSVSCSAGFYCPLTAGPQNLTLPCGMTPPHYCPENHSHPLSTGLGYYATGFVMQSSMTALTDFASGSVKVGGFTSQTQCPRGSYCVDGVRLPCAAGRYGSTVANTNSSCSGLCTEGYFCPEGSSSPKQFPCGTDATVFCPRGSESPTAVSRSYYTHGYEAPSKILDIQSI